MYSKILNFSELPYDIVNYAVHYGTNLLKYGDIVYISAFDDLNNIFVRKINDDNDKFKKLLEGVNTYCF